MSVLFLFQFITMEDNRMKRIFISLLLFPYFVLIPEQNKSDFDSLKKKYERVRKHLDNKNGDHWFLMRDENKDYWFLMRAAARDISEDPEYAIAVVEGLNIDPNTYIDRTEVIIGFNDYGQVVFGSILMHAIVSIMQSAQRTGECNLEVIKMLLEQGGDPEKNVLSVLSKNLLKQLEKGGCRMFKNARELAEYYATYDKESTKPMPPMYYDMTRGYSDQDGCRCCGDILKLFDEVNRKNSAK